jgi:hypothetical protein
VPGPVLHACTAVHQELANKPRWYSRRSYEEHGMLTRLPACLAPRAGGVCARGH